jgi:CHAT domain-containing protein
MKWILAFLFFGSTLLVHGQTGDKNIYDLYADQFKFLLKTRGVADRTIFSMLKTYEDNKITSNENFAKILKNLYRDNDGIGILFFVYDGTHLNRIFFKPGKVIAEERIMISKEKLQQMNNDLQYALQLKAKSADRSPQLRGVSVKNNQPSNKVTLAAITKEFNQLLIPKEFDESYKQLIIIPALNIGSFPFQLLKPYKDGSYLIEKCSFTVSSGLIDLIANRSKLLKELYEGEWRNGIYYTINGRENRNLDEHKEVNWNFLNPLFISNPVYPTDLEYNFPDLPGAKKEVEMARKFAEKSIVLEGSAAVKDSILKYWSNADLIYFATHGIADVKNPMDNSYLVLSGTDPKLTAREIMNLGTKGFRMPELVVLSACQTGLGANMDAGISGLARSFIIAGSNQVVMSLWNVDDDATAYLMNRFLYHLQQPHYFVPSEPLRLAILDTKTKYPNPIHWASFSVFGLSY